MMLTSDQMGRAASSGFVGAGMMGAMEGFGTKVRIPKLDTTIPLYVAGGAAGMVSSALASVTHDVLIPALAAEDKWSEGVPTAVAMASGAAGGYGYWYLMDPSLPESLGWSKVIGLGIASEFVGSQLWDRVVKPMI